MSTEYHQEGGEVPQPEGYMEEEHSSFDELSKELASGTLSRSRAIKLLGVALLGGVLATKAATAATTTAK